MIEGVLHFVLFLAVLGGYIALTVAGHDGNPLLTFLGGQAAAIGVQRVAQSRKP